jgi:3-dehydroquinate synthase
MIRIAVDTGERPYEVLIGSDLLDAAGAQLAPMRRRSVAVVSDENVWAAQGARLAAALSRAGIEALPLLVAPGEASKSWAVLVDLLDRLLALGIGRQDHILAFGGGVVGDLTGLAASLLKRGCSYVQVPTSLLAQVDSSVGGKTGINVAAGKNMVGTFHQPSLVLIDPGVLATLPERELRAGYAEVVKYGLIAIRTSSPGARRTAQPCWPGDEQARQHAIAVSVAAKAAIVAEDERETKGRRALLNLGHTFGHALEAEAGFSSRLLHGEAVAIGMALAFRFSAERGLCAVEAAQRVAAHLGEVKLPTSFDADPGALIEHIRHDKKGAGGSVPFILAKGIGQAFVDQNVSLEDVRDFLTRSRGA